MNKKLTITIAVIAAFLIVFLSLSLFLKLSSNKKSQISKKEPSATQELNNLDNTSNKAKEIQKKEKIPASISNLKPVEVDYAQLYNFLNTRKGSLGIQCLENKCDEFNVDRQMKFFTIWGKIYYYLKTKEIAVINSIKNEIDFLAKESKTLPFQSDHWHCLIAYDLFSKGEKYKFNDVNFVNNLKEICTNNIYLDQENYESQINQINVNDFDAKKTLNLIKGLTIKSSQTPKIQNRRQFVIYATTASDLVNKYLLLNAPSNILLAKRYFDSSIEYFATEKESILADSPLIIITALDLYKITRNDNFLTFAEKFYEYVENISKEIFDNKNNLNSTYQILMLIAEKQLYDSTKKDLYERLRKKRMDTVKEFFYDINGNRGYRINKKLFHNGGINPIIYETRNNTLALVGFVSQ